MASCSKCASGEAHAFVHGTSGYTYHRCRCDVCITAWTEYQSAYRQLHREHLNKLQAQRRAANLEHSRKQDREAARRRRSDPDVRARVRQQGRESYRRHRDANREKRRQEGARYRERVRSDPVLRERAYEKSRQDRQSPRRRRWRQARHSIPAPRRNEPWTAADDAVVVTEGLTALERAYRLGRTVNQVEHRRRKLVYGEKYHPRPKRTCTCQHCGDSFVASKSNAKYCSSSCKTAFYRLHDPERFREYDRKRAGRRRRQPRHT